MGIVHRHLYQCNAVIDTRLGLGSTVVMIKAKSLAKKPNNILIMYGRW